ncbi:MAG: hypothetical protein CSA45_03145 [Gammaproteobacteria bacterium]|nr:MAG: hypothetical protein CSA45_03145 [Gammaproteobacteria bacterium]
MLKESYIKLLNKQSHYNQGNSATKINLHLPVFGAINDFVLKSNRRILEITESEINFSPSSFQIPHITLAMGFIHSIKDYEAICYKISDFANHLPSLDLTFEQPYIRKPGNKYVFIDVNPANKIIKLKKELNSLIKSDFESVKWDILNEPPHITIGYINDKQKEIEKEFYQTPEVTMTVNQINLSFTGSRGSVLGIIKEFGK